MVALKAKQVTGDLKTHVLRVTVVGLDQAPGVNPVRGYVDAVHFPGGARVLGAGIMPGLPDNALDLIAALCLMPCKEPTSNAQAAGMPAMVACTGSAIPPVPPVHIDLAGGQECEYASLVVYQSNASYTKTGAVLGYVHAVHLKPPIWRV